MSNDLLVIEAIKPGEVFGTGNVETLLGKIEKEVATYDLDVSTREGRQEIASVAHKIARSKTTLDGLGKGLTDDARAVVDKINEERRLIRTRLDALKAEVRAPLTEFEEKEKARVAEHEDALEQLALIAQPIDQLTASEIMDRVAQVNKRLSETTWEEFRDRAIVVAASTVDRLETMLKTRQQYEAEQAELTRLREEKEAREAKERDERIASEAAADAKKKAEAKQDAADAVEIERRRVQAEKRGEEEEARIREANKKHRARVDHDIIDAIWEITGGNEFPSPEDVFTAIAAGEIPRVKISY